MSPYREPAGHVCAYEPRCCHFIMRCSYCGAIEPSPLQKRVTTMTRRIAELLSFVLGLLVLGCGEVRVACPASDAGVAPDAVERGDTIDVLVTCSALTNAYWEPAFGGVHRCATLPPADDIPPECPWRVAAGVRCDVAAIETCLRSVALANTCEQFLERQAADCDPEACR